MIHNGIIRGKYVNLRSIEENDARITLDMRLDREKTRFLHPVENKLQSQLDWIKKSRLKNDEYHFTVTDVEGKIIGNVGIYEIQDDSAQVGRILLYGNSLQSFETQLLVLKFGFNSIRLKRLWSVVAVDNKSAWNFTKMFGFKSSEPYFDQVIGRIVSRFELDAKDFEMVEKRISSIIYR